MSYYSPSELEVIKLFKEHGRSLIVKFRKDGSTVDYPKDFQETLSKLLRKGAIERVASGDFNWVKYKLKEDGDSTEVEYQKALDWMYAQLPMYQRLGESAYKKDLLRTLEMSKFFGHPERLFRSVHIAGTNGKGSVTHMIASVLIEAGYKVGIYSSPHLVDFRERIKINGEMVPKAEVMEFLKEGRDLIDQIKPSFFEMTVIMAFRYFAKQNVDWAVIETGLGGRLDSTNILMPELSVITHVAMDHMNMLGDSLESIAKEKAGIIKPGIPVILGRKQNDIYHIFEEKCKSLKSSLTLAEKADFDFELDLKGKFQRENANTAYVAIAGIQTDDPISLDTIERGLKNVVMNTGLRGRFEFLSKDPLIICDIAHNQEAVKVVIEEVSKLNFDRLNIVYGAAKDKDLNNIIEMLPVDASYYLCSPDVPRAMDSSELMNLFSAKGLKCKRYNKVSSAFWASQKNAHSNDLILVIGSAFVVAEVLSLEFKENF
ncbi:MAG: bifunctional folylpolyglutamate synthase/dihydrofolate synthase [Flavobacteriales bacterium]|nr:bifunctional folylpolyglutamate synthase/dihydrofolate synthase [Flavobacteriales bacterium]